LALFKLPAAAGCVVNGADVKVEAEEHDQDHAKEVKDSNAPAAKDDDDHEHGHSQFHVQYALDCTTPANITAIDFDYFRSFPGAQKLEVNLITPKGQSKYEVTRANPRIDLAGMM
jgi:ABC-type Zn2+ transport system substrate-binding protein/surface adhesin